MSNDTLIFVSVPELVIGERETENTIGNEFAAEVFRYEYGN